MSTILTADELKQMWDSYRAALPRWLCFARAIESAVLAKLAQQEPVAWQYRMRPTWAIDDAMEEEARAALAQKGGAA